jgi:hypothetical protein
VEFVRFLATNDFVTVRRQTRDQKLHLTIARGLGLQLEEEPLLI